MLKLGPSQYTNVKRENPHFHKGLITIWCLVQLFELGGETDGDARMMSVLFIYQQCRNSASFETGESYSKHNFSLPLADKRWEVILSCSCRRLHRSPRRREQLPQLLTLLLLPRLPPEDLSPQRSVEGMAFPTSRVGITTQTADLEEEDLRPRVTLASVCGN